MFSFYNYNLACSTTGNVAGTLHELLPNLSDCTPYIWMDGMKIKNYLKDRTLIGCTMDALHC